MVFRFPAVEMTHWRINVMFPRLAESFPEVSELMLVFFKVSILSCSRVVAAVVSLLWVVARITEQTIELMPNRATARMNIEIRTSTKVNPRWLGFLSVFIGSSPSL
jgi:hypothetical protein